MFYARIGLVFLFASLSTAHAQKGFLSDTGKTLQKTLPPSIPQIVPTPSPKQVVQQVQDSAPKVKVDPGRPDKAPSLTVEQHGVTTTIPGDPTKPIPAVESHGNGALDAPINSINKTVQDAQQKLEDAKKDGLELPFKAAGEALKIVGDAAKKAIEDIVAAAKAALDKQLKALWEEYKIYVYAAGIGLVSVLMLPGFIGALFAIWIVRRMDRKRARKALKIKHA